MHGVGRRLVWSRKAPGEPLNPRVHPGLPQCRYKALYISVPSGVLIWITGDHKP